MIKYLAVLILLIVYLALEFVSVLGFKVKDMFGNDKIMSLSHSIEFDGCANFIDLEKI